MAGKIIQVAGHLVNIIVDNIHHNRDRSNGIVVKDHQVHQDQLQHQVNQDQDQDNGINIDIHHKVNNHLIHLVNR